MPRHELVESLVHKQNIAELQNKLEQLHPADVAYVLEALPLDAMSMVGSVNKGNVAFALIKVDKQLYQVRLGDYLGPNFGRVIRVTETELGLRELVQDAAGEWTERAVTLQLQERAQEKAR